MSYGAGQNVDGRDKPGHDKKIKMQSRLLGSRRFLGFRFLGGLDWA
jgi:hypothetical protein